jgi:ubiquinone/menaquinone biosynthesis C-methylase UbiE
MRSVNDFYDSIATAYNGHMTDSDKKVRESVHQLFSTHVTKGDVLDFGGGTGLDLPWFLSNKYRVSFVEPSANMRAVARANNESKGEVQFVESNTDFTKWNESQLPFSGKVNGILANFAVLNCIENIDGLFQKFALVASKDCYVVTTIIDSRFNSMMKNYSILTALRILSQSKLKIYNRHDEKLHPTYIHSMSSIKNASKEYFDLVSITPLESSTFVVLVFKKR